MSVKITGFDQAGRIQPGTVIERVYFAIPDHHGMSTNGVQYADMMTALGDAIEASREKERRANEMGMPLIGEPKITIDTRWVMRSPATTTDAPAERHAYETRDAAVAHLERMLRYAPAASA